MFRRKKSSDVERKTQAISISGPMRITAQAPPSHAAPSAPVYERFARTTNLNGSTPLQVHARKSANPIRSRMTAEPNEGPMGVPEVRQERVGRSGASSARNGTRIGLGISTPSREDVGRVSQHGHHQQMSPPSSPTFPRANGTSNATPRQMPNVSLDALDDPTPPTSLLSKKERPLPEPKRVDAPRSNIYADREDTQLKRMLTPPSPPAATQSFPTGSPAGSITSPSSSRTPSRAPVVVTPPSSFAPASRPSQPDETGVLPSSEALNISPSLGNSLEGPRGPRRTKYSPLAAFGLPSSTSTSTDTSSSAASPQEPPPPLPAKPQPSSVLSQARDQLKVDMGRPSADSDRRTSVQPLKTASVELRVGLSEDELESFHSPLFGAFNTDSAGAGKRNDGNDVDSGVKRVSRHEDELSNQGPQVSSSDLTSNGQAAVKDSDDGVDMEDTVRRTHIAERGRARNGRMTSSVTRPALAPEKVVAPPTPPSPPAPAPAVLRDAMKNSPEGELIRKRSGSVSSAGSLRRKVTMYAKNTDDDMPGVPTVQEDKLQAPGTLIRGQIPTPPTSVDGHGNTREQRLTISSILSGDHSSDVPSPSSFESTRIRKTSSSRRLAPASSFSSLSPSADELANEHIKQADSHVDTTVGEMSPGIAIVPSMVASSSSSSANLSQRDEVRGRPTPKLRTQDLPLQTYPSHLSHQQTQQHHAPPSPPQSPPQPSAPTLSILQARGKSRTRSNRPGTGSSAHSHHYVPPSSASSSDGAGRSPSAFSVLNSFSPSPTNGHIPRKLTKTPPHSARSMMEGPSAAEQYRNQHQRMLTESPEQTDSLVDADPFAKGEVMRALPASDTASISAAPMVPPIPPFARSHSTGTSSGPPSPASPGDYVSSRSQRRGNRLDPRTREDAQVLASMHEGVEENDAQEPPASEIDANGANQAENEPEPEPEPAEPKFYPLEKHLMHTELFGALLPYLTFRDWCALIAVNDALRRQVEHKRELRELVLEHFLRTVGYTRWKWSTKEHIMLTFRDLNSYMRGVSIPSHQYAAQARVWLDWKQQLQERPDDEYLKFNVKTATAQKSLFASSCRAYSRVVLRLRAQAEAMERDAEGDERVYQFTPPQSSTSVNTKSHGQAQVQMHAHARRSMSRVRGVTPSRPGSPGGSSMSHSHQGHAFNGNSNGHGIKVNRYERAALAGLGPRFRSPLFRLGHAPCLRVCVPNPEGVWLSDTSVLECEKELKRAGVLPLLRAGDVVWDTAIGDEGNDGRMVWDGNYLIDLDYTYSRTGEVPQYLHTLSFPPSYFHRVIRTPGNPICHIDISPWGEEIAANLQLLQDRIKTETPQGGHHTVVRWIHRSKFRVRPNPYTNAPIPIPGTSLSVDPGWYGTVIIEIEGTNEGLADLQQRCRSGFPPRMVGRENGAVPNAKQASKVFRLLRERSRPGEIWLRAVREKERLL